MKGITRDQVIETLSLFERALTLDPHSVEAQNWVALMLVIRAGNGFSESPASDFQRAEELVGRALTASSRDWLARYAKGSLLKW
jgi:hypothetical protein